jgi:hypothetical protein
MGTDLDPNPNPPDPNPNPPDPNPNPPDPNPNPPDPNPNPPDPKPNPPDGSSLLRTFVVVLLSGLLLLAGILIARYRPGVVHNDKDWLPIFYLVWIAAVLGSAVNITTQTVVIPAYLFDKITFLAWKLLVAMTFATFLYVLFASQIVSGDLFPHFQKTTHTPYEFTMVFLDVCKPATNQDVCKVLVWSFIAGYLERFVPNIISRIQAEEGKGH